MVRTINLCAPYRSTVIPAGFKPESRCKGDSWIAPTEKLDAGRNISGKTIKIRHIMQAVDLFCWGIFRKHEARDTGWYDCYSMFKFLILDTTIFQLRHYGMAS